MCRSRRFSWGMSLRSRRRSGLPRLRCRLGVASPREFVRTRLRGFRNATWQLFQMRPESFSERDLKAFSERDLENLGQGRFGKAEELLLAVLALDHDFLN